MSRIQAAFEHGKAFIPFITCGDPDLETTEKLIIAMAESGADLIELGIPFSDPTAEGPVIQAASSRALQGGVTTGNIFGMVSRLRRIVHIPLVFMTYANVVFSYGTERFLRTAAQAGIDGLILPDVPYEEREEFSTICDRYGLDLISMVAPTSDERIRTLVAQAKGFVYCVSSLGVTGERTEVAANLAHLVEQVRQASPVPVAIGFGISTPGQAREMARIADGVIVGSAIVRIIGEKGSDAVPYVQEYVCGMKQAMMQE